MIKYKKLLIVLLLFGSITFGQSVLTIGKVVASGANPVLIPVSISSAQLSNVKSISMQINYDPTKVSLNRDLRDPTKKGYTNFSLPNESNFSITAINGVISISWINSTGSGVTLNNKIFDLELNYISGFSELKIAFATIKNMSGAKLNYSLEHGWIAQNTNPAVVVQYPNGGESLDVVGSPTTIKWTSVNISSVDLEYTTDGITWNPIETNISAAIGSYSWTIPSSINSTNCKIKITESGATTSDESDAIFTINSTSTVSLISPNGLEDLKVDGLKKISWTFRNALNVKLEYSANANDPSPTWNTIIASTPASNLSYDWTIPNAISNNCKIRISNAADLTTFDLSDNLFSISNTPVQVSIPDIVQAHLIKYGELQGLNYHWWDIKNNAWQNEYALYEVNGDTYVARDTLIVDGTVPVNIGWLTSVNYLEMKFTFNSKVLKFDSIKTTFPELNNASVSVEGNELHFIWSGGKAMDLHGKIFDMYFTYVNLTRPIQWFPSGSSTPIALSTPWLPDTNLDSRNFSDIKVNLVTAKNSKNKIINTDSCTNGRLSVNNFPAIKLLYPIGGEVLEYYSVTDTIKWASKLVNNVTIQYSTNGGTSWSSDIASIPAINGNFIWTLPDVNSTSCKVRVIDTSNSLRADTSISTFSITNQKTLDLTSPDAGDIVKIGSKKNITWTSKNVNDVKLEFTIDGTNWQTIIASTPGKKHSYSWIVPNTPSTNCIVRIRNVADSTLQDLSSGPFTINNSPVKVSISNLNVHSTLPNISIPISVDKVNSATYINFTIQYNTANLVFDNVTVGSSLSSGNLGYSTDNNIIRIVWISSTPVDASGTLFRMNFKNYNGAITSFTFGNPNQIKDSSGVLIPIELANGTVDVKETEIPKSFSLSQNYPNPFNPSTMIKFELPKSTNVNLTVYNILGQKVITLLDEYKAMGRYEVKLDASNLSNGIYFYCIRTNEFSQTKKMILLK